MRNVFIIGADDHNVSFVEPLSEPLNCHFHKMLQVGDLQSTGGFRFQEPLERCERRLDGFDGSIDGIMGWWDFPVSTMLAVLRERHGLPGASIDAVLSCEHKYWSRLLQKEAAPKLVPAFVALDPFDDDQVGSLRDEPGFPFWIKPIKAHSSQLGFRVNDGEDLKQAIVHIRKRIGSFGGPFDEAMRHADPPDEVAEVTGGWCLVEGIIGGHQVTLEGYVNQGEVRIPTIVDSVTVEGGSSFARYQYPSKLPEDVRARMRDEVATIMLAHGYDDATFNVEVYWDEEEDDLWILEVNPRASQSHTVVTEMVDGLTHLEAMVALSLGEPPGPHLHSRGRWAIAAKQFVRAKDDALVRRVPTREEIEDIEEDLDCHIELGAEEGKRLSDLPNQDSYSFAMATVHLGADSERDLLTKIERCFDRLDFDLRRGDDRVTPEYQRGDAIQPRG